MAKNFKKYLTLFTMLLVIVFCIQVVLNFAQTQKATALSDNGDNKLANAITLFIGSSNALINNNEQEIEKDSEKITPYMEAGRTLVPIRFITEALGAKVDWNQKERKVTIAKGNNKIILIINSKKIMINGKSQELDVAAKIQNGRTFVPLRKLAEALGKKVFYDRGLIILSDKENIFEPKQNKNELDNIIKRVNNLKKVGNFTKFKQLIETATKNNGDIYGNGGISGGILMKGIQTREMVTMDNAAMPTLDAKTESAAPSSSVGGNENVDYSKTNVQVEGVDEADIVKTDGKYIYQVNAQEVIIIKSFPADNMEVLSRIKFSNEENYGYINPIEMYVEQDKLVVIASKQRQTEPVLYKSTEENTPSAKMAMMPPYRMQNNVFSNIIVFDIADRKNPKKVREVEVEGNYVSSRKIGSYLYLVSNKNINYYNILNEKALPENSGVLPLCRDTVVSSDYIEKPFAEISYFPDMREINYMNVAGMDLSNTKPANINTYMGAGSTIYASMDNLYVANVTYDYGIRPMVTKGTVAEPIVAETTSPKENTKLFKFSLDKGNVTFLVKGDVPGRILNQFSMDENGKYFRIATTTGNEWDVTPENMSKNHMYVLDENLVITGKIEAIAPGEKIYSVRFMGNRAYMVTFKKVDPLFVIDLTNPSDPKILGKLKIPGYSDYLHPYDENHIIGFGQDTVETKDNAFYVGMKMAMFDVSDVTNPKQKFVELIGDRGTTSPLLYNHKALLFSKEKNLLAFPVTLMKVLNKEQDINSGGVPQYGTFEYQGAYIYNIDLEKGFELRGRITHLTEDELLKSATYSYDYEKEVQRILYIDKAFYTLSNKILKASSMDNFKEIGSVLLK